MENKKLLTLLVVITLLLTIVNLVWTYSLSKKINPVDNGQNNNGNAGETIVVSVDDDPVKGDSNAPVTIIEFSDYQCPFCSRFVTGAMPQIEKKYIKTGKAKLIFRDYPLPFHENAQKSSEAAQCAADQNKYWEMHDKLFANQTALSLPDLKKYAGQLGLNQATFNSCLDSNKYAEEVKKDLAEGASYGIGGTPSFFIAKGEITADPKIIQEKSQANEFIIKTGNSTMIIGAQPFTEFEKAIEEALKL